MLTLDWIPVAVNFFVSLFASFIAVVVVLWVERARKPLLDFQIQQDGLTVWDGRKLLTVCIQNKPLINPLLAFFVARHPALMCRAYLTFLHEDNQPVYANGHRMLGRWKRTPDPVVPFPFPLALTSKPVTVRDPTRTKDEIDIPPGSSEILDVVIRHPSSDNCYGWHNGYIGDPEPHPDDVFELGKGRYHVLIRVRTGGEDFKHVYRIVNDVALDHFRLEDLASQPKLDESL